MDDAQRQMMAKALLGSGMAQRAGTQLQQVPKYQDYAIQAQMQGQQPLPQTDPAWMKHFQQLSAGG